MYQVSYGKPLVCIESIGFTKDSAKTMITLTFDLYSLQTTSKGSLRLGKTCRTHDRMLTITIDSDQGGKGPCAIVPLAWKIAHQSLCRIIRNGPLKISKSMKKAENGPLAKNSSQSLLRLSRWCKNPRAPFIVNKKTDTPWAKTVLHSILQDLAYRVRSPKVVCWYSPDPESTGHEQLKCEV